MLRMVVVLFLGLSSAAAAPRSTADRLVHEVERTEARSRRLLRSLGRSGEPLARRCITETLRRLSAQVHVARLARARMHGPARREHEVRLTHAYFGAIMAGRALDECRELVGLTAPGRTTVRLRVDPRIPAEDFTGL